MTQPLTIASVNHIARETTNVNRALAFYRDVLGFRQVWRPAFDFGGAWLHNYNIMIHLIEGEPPSRPDEIRTRADHVAFHVENIAQAEKRLEEHGIAYRRNVSSATGIVQLFFHDPDGNHIEIGCYPAVREMGEDPKSAF